MEGRVLKASIDAPITHSTLRKEAESQDQEALGSISRPKSIAKSGGIEGRKLLGNPFLGKLWIDHV